MSLYCRLWPQHLYHSLSEHSVLAPVSLRPPPKKPCLLWLISSNRPDELLFTVFLPQLCCRSVTTVVSTDLHWDLPDNVNVDWISKHYSSQMSRGAFSFGVFDSASDHYQLIYQCQFEKMPDNLFCSCEEVRISSSESSNVREKL